MDKIVSGQQFDWVGIPGQDETEKIIEIDSMNAMCGINAQIVYEDGQRGALVTIQLSDFRSAVELGWLRLRDAVATEGVTRICEACERTLTEDTGWTWHILVGAWFCSAGDPDGCNNGRVR